MRTWWYQLDNTQTGSKGVTGRYQHKAAVQLLMHNQQRGTLCPGDTCCCNSPQTQPRIVPLAEAAREHTHTLTNSTNQQGSKTYCSTTNNADPWQRRQRQMQCAKTNRQGKHQLQTLVSVSQLFESSPNQASCCWAMPPTLSQQCHSSA